MEGHPMFEASLDYRVRACLRKRKIKKKKKRKEGRKGKEGKGKERQPGKNLGVKSKESGNLKSIPWRMYFMRIVILQD